MKKAIIRSNEKLNKEILKHIADWKGTVHGAMVKSMWESGAEYDQICKTAGIDFKKYSEGNFFARIIRKVK